MEVNYKKGLEPSCLLIAEHNGYNYSYNVSLSEIEEGMETLVTIYGSTVYIGGFPLVSKGTNLTTAEEIIRKAATATGTKKKTSEDVPTFRY